MLNIINTDLDIRARTTSELLFGEQATFAFKKPHDIAVDMDGNVLVSDTYKNSIFSLNMKTGGIGTVFNPYGWQALAGVATDNVNGLLAATSGNVVYVMDQKSKKMLLTLGPKEHLQRPVGVAFDPNRKVIYITDVKKHEVHAYDYEGKHLALLASEGSEYGDVFFPNSIAVSSDGKIYVSDSMNFRVQIYNPDFSYYSSFGVHGDMPGMFARPKAIAISNDGMIFVTDAAFGNFQIFYPDGQVFGFVGAPGVGPGRFNQPQGIAIDKDDKIYVVDQTNRRLQIFQYLSDRYLQAHPDEAAEVQKAWETLKQKSQQK